MPRISEQRRASRRRVFLDAARRCFAAQGLAGATMEDITREAGTSVGAIYPYFATKDDLIRAAIAESLDEFDLLLDAVAATDAASSFEPFLVSLIAQMTAFAAQPERPNLFKLAVHGWSHAQIHPLTADLLRQRYQLTLDRIATIAGRWSHPSPHDGTEYGRLIVAILLGSVVLAALDLPMPASGPWPNPDPASAPSVSLAKDAQSRSL